MFGKPTKKQPSAQQRAKNIIADLFTAAHARRASDITRIIKAIAGGVKNAEGRPVIHSEKAVEFVAEIESLGLAWSDIESRLAEFIEQRDTEIAAKAEADRLAKIAKAKADAEAARAAAAEATARAAALDRQVETAGAA